MKKTDCYFYFEFHDMGAHIPCCTFKEYPLGKCPCDECKNYLPKKEVSKIVREYLKNKESNKEVCNTCRSAEPKRGKWINHFDDLFPEDSTIECSICHEHQPVGIDENYCPNCGAKMGGDKGE